MLVRRLSSVRSTTTLNCGSTSSITRWINQVSVNYSVYTSVSVGYKCTPQGINSHGFGVCCMWTGCLCFHLSAKLWPNGIVVIMLSVHHFVLSVQLIVTPITREGYELGSPNLVCRYLSWDNCLGLYMGHYDPLSRSQRSTLWDTLYKQSNHNWFAKDHSLQTLCISCLSSLFYKICCIPSFCCFSGFITALLQNIGMHVDPIILVQKIPDDVEIPGLRLSC